VEQPFGVGRYLFRVERIRVNRRIESEQKCAKKSFVVHMLLVDRSVDWRILFPNKTCPSNRFSTG